MVSKLKTNTGELHNQKKLPLPVGISDYKLASTQYYYVDKTLMIRDFIDERPMVSLFTRPRRFGKTLNMDMLRTFFEKTDEDTSIYFKNRYIWNCGEEYRNYQGKYPVIFITFKDIKRDTWEETYIHISKVLKEEFIRHRDLLGSSRCDEYEKQYFSKVISGNADTTDMMTALLNLSKMLDEHYGIPPIIIIDEYDTPIQQGYVKGYYDEVILFMRNLFSGGLKDNRHLSYGFLTGILRVAKESIFSGLNNLVINSVLDTNYSEYFGFTPEEVKEMAKYYDAYEKYEEICDWYDGYRFGQTEIFNPWSVTNYFRTQCHPQPFWQATGSNGIIGEIFINSDQEVHEKLYALLNGETVSTYIDTGVIYPQIKNNLSSIYSFLLVAGYLKLEDSVMTYSGNQICKVSLPNKEIAYVYNKEILERLSDMIPQSYALTIQEALFHGDVDELRKCIGKLLLQVVSYYDTAAENFYHGLILGLCCLMDNRYEIKSNGESGEGRFDIALYPKIADMPGILIELKAEKNCSEERLKVLAREALKQINDKKYDADMRCKNIKMIFEYGVAFSGKHVEIALQTSN